MADLDVFEDALFTLFAHHQPARGDPGGAGRYENAALPAWCADAAGQRVVPYAIPEASSANTRLFAHHQWDAGVLLADLVATRTPIDVQGRAVVELGAGTGLPSLVAAACGAALCTVTDYPDIHILAALEHNAAMLRARAPHALPLHVKGLAWGDETQAAQVCALHGGRYDVVLAADVLWVSSQHEHLLDSISALLTRHANARCLVAAGYHTGRPATERFFLAARARGLVPDPLSHLGGLYERSIFGEERALRARSGSA
ncbi:nicotinamide N-methyltransferase [Malassezia nana]|uniref:Nicotinamide N-methyltransferase n=1 Tax=Malassezia nana TaxID=180528 RepID=A0AAF0J4L0_9BASI|nr:nicotinamide N-methyltransferase [Malassezia nana]